MSEETKVEWFKAEQGDLLGGSAFQLTVPCQLVKDTHNGTVTSVVLGPYCVQAGQVFSPGLDGGQVTDNNAGQVGC